MTLRYPSNAAVLVAGVPGAGKSTLVARAADPGTAVVLDTDPLRRRWASALAPIPYPVWRPLVHVAHLARAWRALGRADGAVVIAEPATRGVVRRLLVRRARRAGRTVHLLGVHATAAQARAGQRARGRTIRRSALERHLRRWPGVAVRARREGFATVAVLPRDVAAEVAEIGFGRRRRGAAA